MQSVSGAFLSALRAPHTLTVWAEAYRGGQRVGGTLRILGGQVEQSAGMLTSPQRTLGLDLVPAKGLWDALAPAGTTIYVRRGIRYIDGTTESVPLGVFDVDEQSLGYESDGRLSITAPDVWVRVRRARFLVPEVTSGSMLHSAIALASDATLLGVGSQTGNFTATGGTQVWNTDREAAIAALAQAAGAWVYADSQGRVTSRPVPSLYQTPVWTVDASRTGVLLSADRSRSRQRTYSAVMVSGADTNGKLPFAPQMVADDDPDSPTYVSGPFGWVPYFMSSPLITTAEQAQAAGKAALRRVTGLAAGLGLTAVVNPALEAGDVIQVLLPNRYGDGTKVERHVVDSVTIPLDAAGTQQIVTRSTRPEGDVPDDTGGTA